MNPYFRCNKAKVIQFINKRLMICFCLECLPFHRAGQRALTTSSTLAYGRSILRISRFSSKSWICQSRVMFRIVLTVWRLCLGESSCIRFLRYLLWGRRTNRRKCWTETTFLPEYHVEGLWQWTLNRAPNNRNCQKIGTWSLCLKNLTQIKQPIKVSNLSCLICLAIYSSEYLQDIDSGCCWFTQNTSVSVPEVRVAVWCRGGVHDVSLADVQAETNGLRGTHWKGKNAI